MLADAVPVSERPMPAASIVTVGGGRRRGRTLVAGALAATLLLHGVVALERRVITPGRLRQRSQLSVSE